MLMSTAEEVLSWIERHIQQQQLGIGDSLPGELEIAEATQVGRSSVREALTALKVLGIIRSRRKSGITIIREPVLLKLRHYFSQEPEPSIDIEDTLEFRSALEWGLGRLTFHRTTPSTLQALNDLLDQVSEQTVHAAELNEAEVEFHRLLTEGCGNNLASLFAHMYGPIFLHRELTQTTLKSQPHYVAAWVAQHRSIVQALAEQNEKRFLMLLREHTHSYMRIPQTPSKEISV